MPERAAVNELVQLGLESTLGTATAANRQMALLELVPTVDLDIKKYAGQGRKQAGAALSNKDFTDVKWSTKGNQDDALSYSEFIYIMSSLMGRPTPSTHAGGTNVKDWTYDAPLQGPIVNPVASYTGQQGSSVRAHQFAGLVFASITIKGARDGVTASGDAKAQIFLPNQTITAAPTKIRLDPVLGADWTIYRDPTFGALGTTALLRAFEWEYVYSNVFGILWPGNKVGSQNTWAALVELDPTHTAKILCEADAQGDTGITDARAGTTEFFRIDMKGALFTAADGTLGAGDSAINREIKIDLAGKIGEKIQVKDGHDVLEEELPLEVVEDTGWGHAALIVATNMLAAL